MAGVRYELNGRVATLTLDDPDVRNAVSLTMAEELHAGLDRAIADARAVILTAAGTAFCSGANLVSGIASKPAEERDMGSTLESLYHPLIRRIRDLPIPLLTAVNGPAVGLGCALALMGDLVILSDRAYFLFGFSRVALIPDGGAAYLLARGVGRVRAMEILLLDERVSAADALSWGLANRVVGDADLLSVANELAGRIVAGSGPSIGVTRRMVWSAMDEPHHAILATEREEQRLAGLRPDFDEGLKAFRERRKPSF